MTTNPLLARREIPGKERFQKALAAVIVTAIVVAGAWFLTGATPGSDPAHLASIGILALIGLTIAFYMGFKKTEAGSDKESSQSVRQRIDDDRRGRGWLSRTGYNIRRFVSGTIALLGILIASSGIAVLGFQLFSYLRTGDWPSLSLLRVAFPYVEWLRSPESWYGLHKITTEFLAIAPASLALLVVGWLVAGFGSALKQRVRRKA